jgi:hypothetical protein
MGVRRLMSNFWDKITGLLAIIAVSVLVCGSSALAASPLRAALVPLPEPAPYTLRWRVGVGVAHSSPVHFAWPAQRPGWFHDWDIDIFAPAGGYNQPLPHLALTGDERALGMEFVPLISTRGGQVVYAPELLATLAADYPGTAWIVGNEPDIATQDWATPDQYAAAYHTVYQAIKRADPTAVLVAGNVSQVTALRLRYLDAVLAAYRDRYGTAMPADVWGVHVYVLPEQAGGWGAGEPPGITAAPTEGRRWTVEQHDSLALIKSQVQQMRSWMAANGYTDSPLWITEYGILMPPEYGFGTQRVARFMTGSFDLFRTLCDRNLGLAADGGRLVQRWNWFSTRAGAFPAGDLFDGAGAPTPIMHAMARYLAKHGADPTASTCR